MALKSDGFSVTTVVTCEGDLLDPSFPKQLKRVLGKLENIVKGHLYVCKLEPWNSVRVTLSIPREAAVRLRQLAREGSQQLRALGILSVQVEGDQVISLRLAGPERQEIVLQTAQQDEGSISNSNATSEGSLSRLLSNEIHVPTTSVPSDKMQFRSPNVVCPSDSVVPKVPATPTGASAIATSSSRLQSPGPFPFTSMNQALQSRENSSSGTGTTTNVTNFAPPPPYPGKHPPVTLSSPLLVNLLQNDGHSMPSTKLDIENSSTVQANGSVVQQKNKKAKSQVPTCSKSTATFAVRTAGMYSGPVANHLPPKIVNSQASIVTVNNSLNGPSETCYKNLVHQRINSSSFNTGSTSNVSTKIVSATNSNTIVRQTNNSNLCSTNSAIVTKPSVVLQNSGELELSNQSITIANKMPVNSVFNNGIAMLQNPSIPSLISSSSNCSNNVPIFQQQQPGSSSILDDAKSISFQDCSPSLMDDLTPTLTDLKESDLDQLLPTLERDIASSPPELPEVFTDTNDRRKFLINPLTGELELQPSSDESEEEADSVQNVFTGLPNSPVASVSDDDGTCTSSANNFISSLSTTNSNTSISSTEQPSDNDSLTKSNAKSSKNAKLSRLDRCGGCDSSKNAKPATTEKIKLRLKLEKSEPVSSGYKVDVSFVNTASPKKATTSLNTASSPSSTTIAGEELRVPPLHISLRGRNHVVINNKKKVKLNPDGSISKPKARKTQGEFKPRKSGESDVESDDRSLSPINKPNSSDLTNVGNLQLDHTKPSALDSRKIRKVKSAQEHREQNLLTGGHIVDRGKDYEHQVYNTHIKDKLKERRGSDSELAHSAKRLLDNNGLISDKKRRMSQTDHCFDESHQPAVVGSNNVGTVSNIALSPKSLKKEKVKAKESGNSKGKEIDRSKSYAKNMADKLASKQVALPTGEIDMEAKFKQRLLENNTITATEKLHSSRVFNKNVSIQKADDDVDAENIVPVLPNPIPHKDKPPEILDHQKSNELTEKQVGRSPNSGGQGEDSGIESMDALSEKSPNQASQSPHGDTKTHHQVPDILDIEAQLAKMEGLNGDDDEDMNENKQDSGAKLEQCCTPAPDQQQKTKDSVDDPLPVRVTPPLYTYSNVEKIGVREETDKVHGPPHISVQVNPTLVTDTDNSLCPVGSTGLKNKSLLEQLLIDIPSDNHTPSLQSPMTRSLRARTCSKLNSPELIGSPPVTRENHLTVLHQKATKTVPVVTTSTPNTVSKRKRHESENSINAVTNVEINSKRPRKSSENSTSDLLKTSVVTNRKLITPASGTRTSAATIDESSDSDEPLIEVAGKVRKNNNISGIGNAGNVGSGIMTKTKTKVNPSGHAAATPNTNALVKTTGSINTRRSVRATPALNTRSKGDSKVLQPDAEVLRRKTRSSVTEGEGKRRKDVK